MLLTVATVETPNPRSGAISLEADHSGDIGLLTLNGAVVMIHAVVVSGLRALPAPARA